MFETTIRAVYEGGVFRPTEPVALVEGDIVQINVVKPVLPEELPLAKMERNLTPEHQMALQKISDAKTWEEKRIAAQAAAKYDPPLPDGYDLDRALERNRRPWLYPTEPSIPLGD